LSFVAVVKCLKLMLFYCKKYKYRATFCRVKAKEKSLLKKIFTNCGNGDEVILKSGKQKLRRMNYACSEKKRIIIDMHKVEEQR